MNHHRFLCLRLIFTSSILAVAIGCDNSVEVFSNPASPCDDGPGIVLGMNRLLLGDTDRDGTPNPTNGWKQYGFNLDNLVSTTSSKSMCVPYPGAGVGSVYADGNDGIDNSFGHNILPVLVALVPELPAQTSQRLSSGEFTLMLKIEGLAAGPGNCVAVSKLYQGAPLGSAPKLDGTDIWPVAPDSLQNPGDVESTTNVLPRSTIVDNEYQSGPEAAFTLTLSGPNTFVSLPIMHAQFRMTLDADHKAATRGVIAGILDAEALLAEIERMIGRMDPMFCEPPIVSLRAQIRQAADILNDGTQNPNAMCSGISIGLGFDMSEVQLGPVATPAPPAPDPCAPAP